jgi:hypothetical protein
VADTPDTGLDQDSSGEMSFRSPRGAALAAHQAIIGILIGMILCWVIIDWLMESVLLRPILDVNAALLPGPPSGCKT